MYIEIEEIGNAYEELIYQMTINFPSTIEVDEEDLPF